MSQAVVVIGGGQHGLVAALTLSKAGRKVLLVEAHEQLGGLARSHEFHPGFHSVGLLHDSSCLAAPILQSLGLKSHGLSMREPAVQYVATGQGEVFLDGASAEGELSEKDREAYAKLTRFLGKLRKPLGRLLRQPPPSPLGPVSALLRPALGIRALGADDMVELLRAPSMCVADWMRDIFESEELSAAIAHSALIGSFAGPWSPWTAANLLFEGAAKGQEVSGGPAALIRALEQACLAAGATLRTGAVVSRIATHEGRVSGVILEGGETIECEHVVATCDPKTTFLDLVGRRFISDSLARSVANIRMRGAAAKLDIALSGELLSASGKRVELFRTGGSLDDLEKAYDAAKYGQISESPMLDVRAFAGNGVAPEGASVLSVLIHFAPYDLDGGWSEGVRELLKERVMTVLEGEFPGIRARVLGAHLTTPPEIETSFRIREGHIFHGEHAPDQQLFMRPTIDTADYSTPIAGLFVGGSGSHPGGGITCVAGHLAAKALLRRG